MITPSHGGFGKSLMDEATRSFCLEKKSIIKRKCGVYHRMRQSYSLKRIGMKVGSQEVVGLLPRQLLHSHPTIFFCDRATPTGIQLQPAVAAKYSRKHVKTNLIF